MTFTPARRAALKGRVALCGPTGSGKTWTALGWARQLGETVALIDTERRSASLYADEFAFDTCAIDPPYNPEKLIGALKEAEGYGVVIIDSLSHFWEGEGGILEIVDAAAARSPSKNSYAAWGVGTPIQRHMVDSILGFPGHVIVTMRSKMDYLQEKDDKGKTRIIKVGMAPVQRNGVEYEFTVIGDLDFEHRLVISKSRCHPLADRVIQPGRQEDAAVEFRAWLEAGEPLAGPEDIDGILACFAGIEDENERKERKREFVAAFGPPNELRASRVSEAMSWVTEFVPLDGPPSIVGLVGDGDSETAAEVEHRADPDKPSPAPSLETSAELRARAARCVAMLQDEWLPAWRAYMRRTGISSNAERWSDAQAQSVIDWVLSEDDTPEAEGAAVAAAYTETLV